jgi:arylsulfatase A
LKRDIYEGGHRLPFLVKWPGVVPPDSVCSALVSQIDLMATLAAVVGAKLPANAAEDSHDLLPLFKGDKAPVRETHVHNTFANTYAIRHGDWVLVDAKTGYGEKIDPKWDTPTVILPKTPNLPSSTTSRKTSDKRTTSPPPTRRRSRNSGPS